jgi:hypothetical protein
MIFGPVRLLALACAVACSIGCGADAPAPSIAAVSPARGYSDREIRLLIRGEGFLPRFVIDPGSGMRKGDVTRFSGRVGSVHLHGFDWLDMNQLSAWMAPGLPAGEHTLEVMDPRGKPGRLEKAFWSLGPDNDPPAVAFEKPAAGAPVAAGSTIDLAIAARDQDPGRLHSLGWEAWAGGGFLHGEECRLESDPARARCDTRVTVPVWMAPGDSFQLRARAIDASAARNAAEETLSFVVQPAPTAAAVRPARGGIVGGTDLVIEGSGFFSGTKVYLDDRLLLPDGGTIVDSTTIVGRAPAHVEGPATVLIRTPIGDALLPNAFQYERPPQIETVAPEVGDPNGATAIKVRGRGFTTQTQIFFGDALVTAIPCEEQRYISDQEIHGSAPAGHGTTSVWAFDAELGWTRLVDGFSWSKP